MPLSPDFFLFLNCSRVYCHWRQVYCSLRITYIFFELVRTEVHYLSTLVQHWACVYHSPAPQTRPPLPLCFFGASPSARPQQSPSRRAFTTEMAVKVCRSVLLLSRSSGAVASSRPALVVSSQRHHQHIRPVSPRTSETAPRERDRERERGRDRAGEAGPERRQAGLAKEVKLTSVNISPTSFISLRSSFT